MTRSPHQSDNRDLDQPPDQGCGPPARDERLARALRANLRRRKEQAKSRRATAPRRGGGSGGEPPA